MYEILVFFTSRSAVTAASMLELTGCVLDVFLTVVQDAQRRSNPAKNTESTNSYGVTVKGVSNVMVRFARCCSPVPGDNILGYITKGRGVSVHRADCANLRNLIKTDSDKVIEVSWGGTKGTSYIAEIRIKAGDRMGILSDVIQIINDSKLEVNALNANAGKGNDETLYPAWNFCNTYAATYGLTGDLADGWYLPTVAELETIDSKRSKINESLKTAGGNQFEKSYYWSCCQSFSDKYAYELYFGNGSTGDNNKYNDNYVCSVRAFN